VVVETVPVSAGVFKATVGCPVVTKLLSVPVLVPAELVAKALKNIVVPCGRPVRLVL
jgi:hypothetical protein